MPIAYMDDRVKGLDPPTQHLGGFGHSRDILNGDVGLAYHAGRAARREKPHIGLYKAVRQVHQPRLVENRENGCEQLEQRVLN